MLAAVAELADALDSGSSGSKIPWRFEPSQPHFDPVPLRVAVDMVVAAHPSIPMSYLYPIATEDYIPDRTLGVATQTI